MLQTLIAPAVIAAAITAFVNVGFAIFYNKQFEKFKAELSANSQKDLAAIKSQYDRQLADHNQRNALVVQEQKERRDADLKLLDRLKHELPSNGAVSPLERCNSTPGNFTYDYREFEGLRLFANRWNNAESAFLDPVIDLQRRNLVKIVREFLMNTEVNTQPTHEQSAIYDAGDRDSDPEGFDSRVSILFNHANAIVKAHQELIRLAREVLNY